MTVYLRPELARRLAVHAASTDTDVSDVLAEIVEAFFRT
jgi:hypothetical protein